MTPNIIFLNVGGSCCQHDDGGTVLPFPDSGAVVPKPRNSPAVLIALLGGFLLCSGDFIMAKAIEVPPDIS